MAIPPLERMAKDGEAGRKKLGQITRYVTVVLGLVLGVAYYFMVRNKYNALDEAGPERAPPPGSAASLSCCALPPAPL